MSSLDTFWCIPPIQDSITSHLFARDIHSLCRVSKALHSAFIPLLWKNADNILHSNVPRFLRSPARRRHKQFVQTVSIYSSHSQQWFKLFSQGRPAFPNLQSMTFIFDRWAILELEDPIRCIQHATSHSTLTRICFEDLTITRKVLEAFEAAMLKLVELKHLRIKSSSPVDCLELARILSSCTNLEKVEIVYFDSGWARDQTFVHHQEKASTIYFPETRIKDLEIFLRRSELDTVVVRFLESCPRLERLKFDTPLDYTEDSEALANVLQNHCTRLKKLCLERGGIYSLGLFEVLSRCPPLTKLEVRAALDFGAVVDTICSRHASTLEYLDLFHGAESCSVRPKDVFAIAHACTSLKTFRALIDWPRSQIQKAVTLQAIQSLPWRCMKLKTLSLYFYYPSGEHVFLDPEGMDVLFEQVGRMRLLNELDLFLGHGGHVVLTESFLLAFKPHLAGLANIRYFCFSDCYSRPLKEKEVAMVREHWKLKEFCWKGKPQIWE